MVNIKDVEEFWGEFRISGEPTYNSECFTLEIHHGGEFREVVADEHKYQAHINGNRDRGDGKSNYQDNTNAKEGRALQVAETTQRRGQFSKPPSRAAQIALSHSSSQPSPTTISQQPVLRTNVSRQILVSTKPKLSKQPPKKPVWKS